MTRIVFMDTETTGLEARPGCVWEFACIIRDPGQPDVEFQTFVRHDKSLADSLPEAFRKDYDARYDEGWAIGPGGLAQKLREVMQGRAHVVGAVPNFDTERLSLYLDEGEQAPWHYHLIDVENLAVGYLAGRYSGPDARIALPWDSDALSARLGVVAPVEERHTALGDCRWARAIYDAVMGT